MTEIIFELTSIKFIDYNNKKIKRICISHYCKDKRRIFITYNYCPVCDRKFPEELIQQRLFYNKLLVYI